MKLFIPSRKVILAVVLLNLLLLSGLTTYLGYNYYFGDIGDEVNVGYQMVKTDDQTIFWISYVDGDYDSNFIQDRTNLISLDTKNQLNTINIVTTTLTSSLEDRYVVHVADLGLFAVGNEIWMALKIYIMSEVSAGSWSKGNEEIENFVFLIKGDMDGKNQFSYAIIESPENYTIIDTSIDPTGTYIGFSLETSDTYYSIEENYNKTNAFAIQTIFLDTIPMSNLQKFPLIHQENDQITIDGVSHQISNTNSMHTQFEDLLGSAHMLNYSNNIQIPNDYNAYWFYSQIDANRDMYIRYEGYPYYEIVNNLITYNFVLVEFESFKMYKWYLPDRGTELFIIENLVVFSTFSFEYEIPTGFGDRGVYNKYLGVFNPRLNTSSNFPTAETVFPHANKLVPIGSVYSLFLQSGLSHKQYQFDQNNGVVTIYAILTGFLKNNRYINNLGTEAYDPTPIEQSSSFVYSITLDKLLNANNNTFTGKIHLLRGGEIDSDYKLRPDKMNNYRKNGYVTAFITRVIDGNIKFLYFADVVVIVPYINHFRFNNVMFETNVLGKEIIS